MADGEMEFCLLGPLLVRRCGTTVAVPRGLQRSLLATLLLSANTVVPVQDLAEALWGHEPPPSARASLHNLVMRLRKSLADTDRSRITAQPGGYRLRVGPGELDVDRFEALLSAARNAQRARSYADAAARLRLALSLWRGQPLAGIPPEPLALREAPRLEEMRLQALEARIDADLHLGRHAEVIIELRQLAAANPLRERLHALLMLALYENGQQAQALAAYQAARSVLATELGVEPGRELRQLQRRILAGRPAGGPAEPASATAGAPAGTSQQPGHPDVLVPRQLPATTPYFAGRSAELAELDQMLNRIGADGTTMVAAIAGTAGAGKTALALHWATHATERFPDGQLYANLHGFGPAGAPLSAAEAVRLFLDGLGVAPDRIPADLDAQAALYRSLLAGKKVLIILDNARDPAQIRPLLPGSAGCLVLITSRSQLTGLAAADGASLLTLDVLTELEAREMLALRLTASRVAAEPTAVAELTMLCARLPLALNIAMARAMARPALPLGALVAELRDAHALLDVLGTGDAASDMRTVFSWSCRQLTGPTARMFRLLGLHPGPDVTIAAAASLAGVSPSQARRAVSDLARAHLITEHLPGRFAFHDLLRAYSAEEATSYVTDADRHAARQRLLDHYLHTAFAASLLLSHRYRITLSPAQPLVLPEAVTDRLQALAWFQAERPVLLAVARLAIDSGSSAHAWQLPWTMATFLDWSGYWHELAATQRSALTAAEQLGDWAGQAEAHRYLGRGLLRLGGDATAITHLQAAIELAAQVGDETLQGTAHHDLGGVLESQGRVGDALAHAEQARRLYHRTGYRWGEAVALSAVGWSHTQLGNYHGALRFCGMALAMLRDLQIILGQAATLDSLGYAHHQLGQYSQAIACFQEAMSVDGDAGDRRVRAEILIHLGDSLRALGNQGQARKAWREALAILEALRRPDTGRVRSRLAQCAPARHGLLASERPADALPLARTQGGH